MADAITTVHTTFDTLAEEGVCLLSVQGVAVAYEVWTTGDGDQVITLERPTDGDYRWIYRWRETERDFPVYPAHQANDVMRETLERAFAQIAAEER